MRSLAGYVCTVAVVVALTAGSVSADLIWDISDTGIAALYVSLKLDASTCPHMAYGEGINFALQYAKWTGTAWHTETVDGTKYCASGNSLALDSAGRPWISYCAAKYGTSRLKLARWTGSAWDIQDVKTYVSSGTSLQLDSLDRPHIAYTYGNSPPQVEYAQWNGTEWEFETVDPGADVHSGPRLVLDSQDRPHLAYSAGDPAYVKYAAWNGTGWDIEVVACCGDAGFHALALNAAAQPRVLYAVSDGEPGEYYRMLKYAAGPGPTWETRDVRRVWGGIYGYLALTAEGSPRVTYWAEYGSSPTYMTWNGTSWDSEVLEADGGDPQALVVDQFGYPHMAYLGTNTKYASGRDPLAVRWPR
jgi:hypothetical protein